MPKISVITTTYKHEKFISRTIESMIAQSIGDWELLIWDDSPDNATWEIIASYIQKYPDKIRAWHHHPSRGIVNNMNFLLQKVHTETSYIAFLEWDDLFTPDNLEKRLDIFHKYPQVGMVYNNFSTIDQFDNILQKNYFWYFSRILKNEKLDMNEYINGLFNHTFSIIMIKREVMNYITIKSPNSDPTYTAADFIFFWETAHSFSSYGVDLELSQYRIHSNNFSKKSIKTAYDHYCSIVFLRNKYNLLDVEYYFHSMTSFFSFLENKKLRTIKHWVLWIFYNYKKDLLQRVGLIFLSLLPFFISRKIFNLYRKKVWRETI